MLLQSIPHWTYLVTALSFAISLLAAGHAVISKRDSNEALAWVGVIWLVPFLGGALYLGFGINRIRRRAQLLLGDAAQGSNEDCPTLADAPRSGVVCEELNDDCRHLEGLRRIVSKVTGKPLLGGNSIQPLVSGDEAYPAMLSAIRGATRSVGLSTYIFGNDRIGQEFTEALAEAVQRGVEVRVLLDDVGRRYSWPPVFSSLNSRGIRVASFLPGIGPMRLLYSNLRNHRKILVVDGEMGFTGGINIRERNVLALDTRKKTQDLHFQIAGPCLAHLHETFASDWEFCTGEKLSDEAWSVRWQEVGTTVARGISDGPDEDLGTLRWTLLGAITSSRQSIVIITPYFLPDASLIAALNIAVMRGVDVTIVLPRHSNVPLVHWASRALWWQLLEHGCKIELSDSPFDHSKLMLVDGVWALLGSTNWDARSLRLNFEFNLECYGPDLGDALRDVVADKLSRSRPVTLSDVDSRSLGARLRDGMARLLSPYL